MTDSDVALLTSVRTKVECVSSLNASCNDLLTDWREVGNVGASSAYINLEVLTSIARILSPSIELNNATESRLWSDCPVVRSQSAIVVDVAVRREGSLSSTIIESEVPYIPVLTVAIGVDKSPASRTIASLIAHEVLYYTILDSSSAVADVVALL